VTRADLLEINAMRCDRAKVGLIGLLLLAVATGGCGTGLFNAAFVNSFGGGGIYPVTPGPRADFVLARASNSTDSVLTFFVTIERERLALDSEGRPQFGENGEIITEIVLESVQLTTIPGGRASDLGTLFPCSESAGAVRRIGLGETLSPGDAHVFVIDAAAYDPTNPLGAQIGNGVEDPTLNPLSLFAGNFNCGDTVVFQAFQSTGASGGIRIRTFVSPGSEQPDQFSGANTFLSFEQFLQAQVREDERP
jgi:hypothetical protein